MISRVLPFFASFASPVELPNFEDAFDFGNEFVFQQLINAKTPMLLQTNNDASVAVTGQNIGTLFFSQDDIYGHFRSQTENDTETEEKPEMLNDATQFSDEPEVEEEAEESEFEEPDERSDVYIYTEEEALFPQYDSEYESFNSIISARTLISYDSSTWNSCFSCNADSFGNCNLNGEVVECNAGEVCFAEVRARRGVVFSVEAGCKRDVDCTDQRNQNNSQSATSTRLSQCRPQGSHTRFGPSICRQCFSPCDEGVQAGAFCWDGTSTLQNWTIELDEGAISSMGEWDFANDNLAFWSLDLAAIQQTNLVNSQ